MYVLTAFLTSILIFQWRVGLRRWGARVEAMLPFTNHFNKYGKVSLFPSSSFKPCTIFRYFHRVRWEHFVGVSYQTGLQRDTCQNATIIVSRITIAAPAICILLALLRTFVNSNTVCDSTFDKRRHSVIFRGGGLCTTGRFKESGPGHDLF
jgi:hypothetical protein